MLVQEMKILSKNEDAHLLRIYHNRVPPCKRGAFEHFHHELEISIFKSGEGTYNVSNHEYDFRAGDIFLFSSNEKHYAPYISNGEDMVAMGVHFDPHFIWSPGNDLFNLRFLDVFLNRSEHFENRLDRDNPSTKRIAELMFLMEQELREKKADYELMIKIHLLSILVILNRDYDYVNPNANALSINSQNLKQVELAIGYINEHFTEEITLDQLATVSNMSRSYFALMFKTLNGSTAWDYIINRRVQRAMELLSTTNEAIVDIAYKCGFNNSTNFNKAFRKLTGTVPSEYRKNPQIVQLFE